MKKEEIEFYFEQLNVETLWFTFNSYFVNEDDAKEYSKFRGDSKIEKIEKSTYNVEVTKVEDTKVNDKKINSKNKEK